MTAEFPNQNPGQQNLAHADRMDPDRPVGPL